MKEGVTIPNGTSWSADNKTMYFTDSPSGKIMAYPYDLETGEAKFSEGKPFFTCPYEGAVPDGKNLHSFCFCSSLHPIQVTAKTRKAISGSHALAAARLPESIQTAM